MNHLTALKSNTSSTRIPQNNKTIDKITGNITPTTEYKDENIMSNNTPSTMHSTISSLNEESWFKSHPNKNYHPTTLDIPDFEHVTSKPSSVMTQNRSNVRINHGYTKSGQSTRMPWPEAVTNAPSQEFQGGFTNRTSPSSPIITSRNNSAWTTVMNHNHFTRQPDTAMVQNPSLGSHSPSYRPRLTSFSQTQSDRNTYASKAQSMQPPQSMNSPKTSNANSSGKYGNYPTSNYRARSGSTTSYERLHKYGQGHSSSATHGTLRGNKPISSKNIINTSRSAPEVLKTLLRKKACLYEAGTSRAIALVTWLVGRKLALEKGYFSRQLLQSGVHAVVGQMIDSGLVTRTKVNRCMQIILNSCFHYIIPRPDGMEESGATFREIFNEEVEDDSHLISHLDTPWDNLDISLADNAREEDDDDDETSKDGSTKRLVLLCFNENVRSAEDVLRCHNDFIRDAAISANLCLSAEDWRNFFSRKDEDGSFTSSTLESTTSVPNSPIIRGNDGHEIPYLSFDIPSEVTESMDAKEGSVPWAKSSDVLGQMSSNELSKFRTTWCCKRYDHNERLCRFAHINVNMGWLRRDPSKYQYSEKMCPHVSTLNSDRLLNGCVVNSCKDALLCKFAHSEEEVKYHPNNYKRTVCHATDTGHTCHLLDICPLSHLDQTAQRSVSRQSNKIEPGKPKISGFKCSTGVTPVGAPILYLNPAPPSAFDKSLSFPGLCALYRHNCAVNYAHQNGAKSCIYSLF
jgi:hypothetical protein